MTILNAIKKYAKAGDKFYSTVFGTLEFVEVTPDDYSKFPIIMKDSQGNDYGFTENGCFSLLEGAERVLFPDAVEYNREWITYIKAKAAEEKRKSELNVNDHIESDGHQYVITSIITTTIGYRIIYAVPIIGKVDKSVRIDTENKSIKKVDKFNIKSLKPFDQVLVRDHGCIWTPNIFGYVYCGKYHCTDDSYDQCIPYNNETYSLVGNREDAPKFYRQ